MTSHFDSPASRRMFLARAGAMSAMTATAAPLALNLAAIGSAAAAAPVGYKAIVCLFFFGGNDSFNMVLPTDSTPFANYSVIRNQAPESIALLAPGTAPNAAAAAGSPARLGGVLPIFRSGDKTSHYALHPLMGTLADMFTVDRRLAILPNIGPLIMPTTKAQYALSSYPKPASLFSHNDQQNTWQSFRPEGGTIGWGGRMGDLLASSNGRPVFTSISAAGNAVWLSGQSVRQYQVGTNGAIRMGTDTNNRIYGSTEVGAAMGRIVRATRGSHVFETDMADVAGRSIDAEATLRTALRPASDAPFGTAPASGTYNAANDPKLRYINPLTGASTFNSLAQQFQIVARMIDAGSTLSAQRQVFFVSIGGFDTHDAQNRGQADLYAKVAQALRYFDTSLGDLGARDMVTTFTASDFGRTFTSNGDGTDHGWGSHHFVMGGAVRGGELYGRFPVLGTKNANNNNFDSSADQLGNGSLLPVSSVDQLAATLGKWFGISDADALTIFPNLGNFSAASRDLGFMNTAS